MIWYEAAIFCWKLFNFRHNLSKEDVILVSFVQCFIHFFLSVPHKNCIPRFFLGGGYFVRVKYICLSKQVMYSPSVGGSAQYRQSAIWLQAQVQHKHCYLASPGNTAALHVTRHQSRSHGARLYEGFWFSQVWHPLLPALKAGHASCGC